MLGYLPADKSQWEETLDRQRKLYSHWHLDLIVNPRKELERQEQERQEAEAEKDPELEEITSSDHVC